MSNPNDLNDLLDRATAAMRKFDAPAASGALTERIVEAARTAHARKSKWTMNPSTKWSLAALLAIGLTGAVIWSLERHPSMAFGEVQKQVQQIKTARFKVLALSHPPD